LAPTDWITAPDLALRVKVPEVGVEVQLAVRPWDPFLNWIELRAGKEARALVQVRPQFLVMFSVAEELNNPDPVVVDQVLKELTAELVS